MKKSKKSENDVQVGGGNDGAVSAADGKQSRRAKKQSRDRQPVTPPPVAASGGTAVIPASDAGFFSWLPERPFPTRESAEAEAARELQAAANPSLNLLAAAVPNASSADDAYRTIESQLGEFPPDPDGTVPRHQLWSDDTVVFYHLRRHFGENSGTESMQRRRSGWYPIKAFGPLE